MVAGDSTGTHVSLLGHQLKQLQKGRATDVNSKVESTGPSANSLSSLRNSIVIPGELALASTTRNPGNQTLLDARFRGHDGGKATDITSDDRTGGFIIGTLAASISPVRDSTD